MLMTLNIDERLHEELKDLRYYVALATINPSAYQKTNLNIIKHLVAQKVPGVYVTLNRPYESIRELLMKNSIDERLIIFIDAVTKTAGGELQKTDQCLFIGSPENLTDISLAMDQAVRAIPGNEKFVFFDSLSTLLLYNDKETVARFIHFLSGKMRVWKVRGIIISLQNEKDEPLIDELTQFCDVKIDLGVRYG